MKCFIEKLTGNDFSKSSGNEMCTPFPPIVSSLIASVAFVALMTIVSHLVH